MLATAVPEVVTTATARPPAVAMPRARKAADRSSMAVVNARSPRAANSPAAAANGPERLPGHSTSRVMPC